MSPNVRRTLPLVAKISGLSRFRASVFSQLCSNGSEDFIACAELVARVDSALLSKDENRYSSRVLRDRYGVPMRCGVPHTLHAPRYYDRYLRCLSPLFHRRAEDR